MLETAKPSFFVLDTPFTESKYGRNFPERNNDVVVKLPGFTAVFDGAGITGREIADTCAQVLGTMPPDADERTYNTRVTAVLAAIYGLPKPNERMPACTAAILSHERAEVWHYGDAASAQIWKEAHEVYQRALAWENQLAESRRFINQMMIDSGELTRDDLWDRDPGRTCFREVSTYQHIYANRVVPMGYSVLCARPVPDELAHVVPVYNHVDSVVLLTDGYNVSHMRREDFLSREAADERLVDLMTRDPFGMDPTLNLNRKGMQRGQLFTDDRSYARISVM